MSSFDQMIDLLNSEVVYERHVEYVMVDGVRFCALKMDDRCRIYHHAVVLAAYVRRLSTEGSLPCCEAPKAFNPDNLILLKFFSPSSANLSIVARGTEKLRLQCPFAAQYKQYYYS